jgi:hypothetical protein
MRNWRGFQLGTPKALCWNLPLKKLLYNL